METSDRREEILRHLCRERSSTIYKLASLFGVSARTIQRDISALSLRHPIYTQVGKYWGGVYIREGYYSDRLYLSDIECEVLKKTLSSAYKKELINLDDEEIKILKNIIEKHSKAK